jgi:hypothetical protein
MARAGILFDLVGACVIWLTLRLICPFVGFA